VLRAITISSIAAAIATISTGFLPAHGITEMRFVGTVSPTKNRPDLPKEISSNPIFIPPIDLLTIATYKLTKNGSNDSYPFEVQVLTLGRWVKFRWWISGAQTGTMSIVNEAIDSAMSMTNLFEDGEKKLLDRQTSIFLSRKAYRDLKAGKIVELAIDGKSKTFQAKTGNIHDIVKVADGTFDQMYIEEVGGTNKMWIFNNPQYPLILKMQLDKFAIAIDTISK
jgi:hypothetical protein